MSDDLALLLQRTKVLTGVTDIMATLTARGLGSSTGRMARYTTSLLNKVVDNKNYAYNLTVAFSRNCSTAVQFCGAKIE